VKTRKIGGVAVLTNAKGFTLYWFGIDTKSKSNCNGSCANFWPPVKGPATASAGVTGKLGTIKRSDRLGSSHVPRASPLRYTGDAKPGQNKGNGPQSVRRGLHEVTVLRRGRA